METTHTNGAMEVQSVEAAVQQLKESSLEDLLEVYRENAVNIARNKYGMKDFTMTVQPGSMAGDNYIGIVHRITVTDNVTGQKRNMILKVPPQNEARRQQFNCRLCFLREIKVYDEILTEFRAFEESKGVILSKDRFYEYAECFLTLDMDPHEALYFDDLRETGFEMFSRFEETTFDHSCLLMKTLAKYHAISFAMKDQVNEQFAKYKDMDDLILTFMRSTDMESYSKILDQKALATLDKEKDAVAYEKAKRVFDTNRIELCAYLVNGKAMDQFAIVCHGDCWNNNMLFKNDENGKPVEIRLIDFQVARYASPACDLLYYIFCSTHKTLRDNHYEDLLQVYHKSLSQHLARLGSDAEKLFPYSALKSELKRVGKFGLIMAVMLLPVLVTTSENSMDLDAVAEQISNGETIEQPELKEDAQVKFNVRMRDVLIDLARFGYLD